MKRITHTGFVFVFVLTTILTVSLARAQNSTPAQDQSSLGDYARSVHKAPAAKSKPKVFDNDNLPKDDKLSIVGEPAAANAAEAPAAETGDKAAVSADNKAAAAPPAGQDETARRQAAWKDWQEKLSSQKNLIDLAARELDVLQREYQIRAAAMYADAGNRLRNSAQWDKQETDYKAQLADKQKALDDAKQKLDDMQEDARKAGVPAAMREP